MTTVTRSCTAAITDQLQRLNNTTANGYGHLLRSLQWDSMQVTYEVALLAHKVPVKQLQRPAAGPSTRSDTATIWRSDDGRPWTQTDLARRAFNSVLQLHRTLPWTFNCAESPKPFLHFRHLNSGLTFGLKSGGPSSRCTYKVGVRPPLEKVEVREITPMYLNI